MKRKALSTNQKRMESMKLHRLDKMLRDWGFSAAERIAFTKHDYGPWFQNLINDRLAVRHKGTFLGANQKQKDDAVYRWYVRHRFVKDKHKPYARLKYTIDPWKAIAHYKKMWQAVNPDKETTPKPPKLTKKLIAQHEKLAMEKHQANQRRIEKMLERW